MEAKAKRGARLRRHARVRKKVTGSAERPRLAVFRSNRHIYAQLIDDRGARTLAAASDLAVTADGKTSRAAQVGKAIAERARALGVERVVFGTGFMFIASAFLRSLRPRKVRESV